MVKEKVEFDGNKICDIQKDVIHFERLIGDLIGILSKSISFCIHSGESVNELVNRLTRNCEAMNDKNGDDPHIIIQESSFLNENDSTMNNNDNGIDYIRFTNNGPVYSLPKRITNSLVGTYLYEQCQENQKTVDGEAYLDYPYDETVAPLLIDSLMNKKVNIVSFSYEDQLELLSLFEYYELPIPEELMKTYCRRDHKVLYKEGDEVMLFINGKKDELLRYYWKKNGLWNKIINGYNDGYVYFDEKNNEMLLKMNYAYIDYIDDYIKNNCIYISEEEIQNINKELLENEMYGLFGDQGRNSVKNGWNINFSFSHSRIVDPTTETPLVNWLGKEKKWKLLFRASEHNYSISSFHDNCNHKGETVTIIKHIGHNNKINIFGGYTDQDWTSEFQTYKPYSKEFLFTLSNEHDIPPTKYDYKYSCNNWGIYCDSFYGPTFGYPNKKSDMYICDRCHTKKESYCYGLCYDIVNTPQKSSLFVNTSDAHSPNYFIVEDYEVWGRA
ncbi:hypothetical protein WA158_002548 [Blastocystis sp. Blastoise]